ncbi:hypothetical protein BS50DRAFT_590656 [Corynespora cassiicola Philippines]|uniref:Nudix hydrolase domain-containing protein n=1 Tax=Corynespora cassiicola Philippines TaxID=1448308 RepID=A0A2T2NDV7_CORCC|nr:hypothetical protein BS50DRAFT_590656 [Corynespora cassiicola Philippines]
MEQTNQQIAEDKRLQREAYVFQIYELVKKIDGWPYLQDDPEAYRTHMENYYYFMVRGIDNPLGYIHKSKVDLCIPDNGWNVDQKNRTATLGGALGFENYTYGELSECLGVTVVYPKHTSPPIPKDTSRSTVYDVNGKVAVDIISPATAIFGVRTFEVHLIISIKLPDYKQKLLIRGLSNKEERQQNPNLAHVRQPDLSVRGIVQRGETPMECALRLLEEQINIHLDEEVKNSVTPCGILTYHMAGTEKEQTASQPKTHYVYELSVSEIKFNSELVKGKGEGLFLVETDWVFKTLKEEQFPPSVTMTWADYFMRNGFIEIQHEEYLDLYARLHRNLAHSFRILR